MDAKELIGKVVEFTGRSDVARQFEKGMRATVTEVHYDKDACDGMEYDFKMDFSEQILDNLKLATTIFWTEGAWKNRDRILWVDAMEEELPWNEHPLFTVI